MNKAKQFAARGSRFWSLRRIGVGPMCTNDLVKIARGNVVIFTDADSSSEEDFVKEITRPFSDAAIGCVVGRLIDS